MLKIKHFAILLTLISVSTAQAVAHNAAIKNSAQHIYAPGQKLKIVVLGEDALSKEYHIDESGMILMPLIGKLHIAGKKTNDVEILIKTSLQDGYILDPIISIMLLEDQNFYILGAVHKPGRYRINAQHATIFQAVALAGGFKQNADKKQFEIVRHHDERKFHIRGNSPYAEILSGDVIIVDEEFF